MLLFCLRSAAAADVVFGTGSDDFLYEDDSDRWWLWL
jgi:hypothetical protein